MKKISVLMDLKGRGAIVTGGAGHIGMAACESLLESGASVTILDISAKDCREKKLQLQKKFPAAKIFAKVINIADEKKLRRSVHEAKRWMGSIDVIIHSAAFVGTTKFPGWVVPFNKQSVKAWDAAMRVNLTAAFVLTQEAEKYLQKSTGPSVIFISSIHGLVAPDMGLYAGTSMGNPAAYGVSKAGLIQLARYLSTVLAPKIRVNAISPGGVWRNQPGAFHQCYKARTPAARMAAEEDLKGAVIFLASDLSRYVTGQNIVIDGGYTAW